MPVMNRQQGKYTTVIPARQSGLRMVDGIGEEWEKPIKISLMHKCVGYSEDILYLSWSSKKKKQICTASDVVAV